MSEAAPASADDYARAHDTLDMLTGLVEAEALARRAGGADGGARMPVVVVSGFLGAGKTTLMRRLLVADHGMRIAALVNDVATLEIDATLISDVAGDAVSLSNGCVCCSQSGGAARALIDAAARDPRPDAAVIEASGVADPFALAQVADAVPGARVDAVVTVVDAAASVPEAAAPLLVRQVAAADLILLNKTDLTTPAAAEAAALRLAGLAPRAQILRTVGCAVPPAVVLDGAGGRTRRAPNAEAAVSDELFRTFTLAAAGPVDRRALEDRLDRLPEGVLRIKGFVRLRDTDRVELLQGVGRRWRWEPAPGRTPEGLAVIALADAVDAAALDRHFAGAGLHTV